ncbi:type II secretion system F family protein [Sciscionella marina]|uniref:type II secretion system F family protein n=1 Tax=Sciscionella marina TaxID=508770 RepID=UPI0003A7B3C6|nr:type II secretion system F family protein [Sciscionella marina]
MITTAVAALLGLGTATGALLILSGLRRRPGIGDTGSGTWRWRPTLGERARDRRWLARVVIAAGAGLVVGAGTGWVVGAILTAAGVWFLPRLVGPDRAHARRVARIEAIASWTEMLRDVLAAAAGLEQTILATAPLAPVAIRREITTVATRLENGQRLAPALRQLSEELADPTADLVLASLVLAAEHQARELGELLGSLATAAREQAAMRMRVETGRARTRTSVRVIVATTLAFAAGVVVFNRAYLAVYDHTAGQMVLLVLGALFAAGFAWLARIATSTGTPRVLSLTTRTPQHDQAGEFR